mgnify:CR=1 FL=1
MPIGLKWLLWFLGFTNGTRWESLLKMIVMWVLAMITTWWYLARTVDDEAVNGSLERVGTKKNDSGSVSAHGCHAIDAWRRD